MRDLVFVLILSYFDLQQSAFEGPVFTHADVKPGMRVKGKVISVDDKGALVQLASGVKALCPVSHMSEYAYPRRSAKFKVDVILLAVFFLL